MLRFIVLAALVSLSLGTGVLPDLSEEVLSNLSPAGSDGDEVGPPGGGVCSDPQLLACQAKFNGDLGITGHADWHTPWVFHYALQNIYKNNGTQGVIAVCRAYRDFANCLGTSYSACVNPLFLLQHGYGVQNSFTYPAILAGLHFQCGGGLETLLGSFPCIQNQLTVSNVTVQICIATYQHDMSVFPNKGCQNALQFINCVRAPFNAACGAPASWYECEYTRVGIAIHQPYCNPLQLRCYVGLQAAEKTIVEEEGTPEDHPALAFKDKAAAFQAAMQEMARGSQAKVYDDVAAMVKNENEKQN